MRCNDWLSRLALGVILLGIGLPRAFSQQLYSFIDENGVRNFTNIPPTGRVKDLKVLGPAPMTKPAVAPAPTKESAPLDPIINKYAQEYQVDPQLIRSMISTESAFNPRAVSVKGAMGLMQLMPATAARVGVRNAFNPEENIRGGTRHMRNLLDRFDNDLTLSLAAYNAGENLVQRVNRVPDISETKNYVKTVTKKYGKAQSNQPPATESQANNRIYKYLDSKGVLHLTNIPPTQGFSSLKGNPNLDSRAAGHASFLQVP